MGPANGWSKSTARRRSWRKLHIGIDAGSGEIVAVEVARKEIDDGARTAALLDQFADLLTSFTADCTYDQDRCTEHDPDAAVIVPPRAIAVPSASAETAPTQRDLHLRTIAELGHMGAGKNPVATIFGPRSRHRSVDTKP